MVVDVFKIQGKKMEKDQRGLEEGVGKGMGKEHKGVPQ